MNLTANQWNNVSVSSYLDSATFTIRFLDGIQTGDTTENTWQKDCTILHLWNATGGNSPPTNDICDSDTYFDVDVYGWVNQTVSDADLVADLFTVEIEITTSDAKTFTLLWTQSTGVFSETSDADGICTLDAGGSQRVNIDTDTDRIEFKFMVSVATQYGACNVQATTVDDQSAQDVDTYTSEFTINAYSSITVDDSTHGWTGLSPGSTDILINSGGGSDGDIDVTVTTNFVFDLKAKGDGPLTSGSDTIPLNSVKIHATTLGSATTLSTVYANVGGLSSQTMGENLAKSLKLWLTVPNPQEDSNSYSYTLSIQVTESL